jgi:type I restriction enzyme S subunit
MGGSFACLQLNRVADLDVGYAFKSEWFQQEGIRLLRGENVGYGSADWKDQQCLSHERSLNYQECLLNENDVIIGMDRTFTKTGVKITVLKRSDCPSLLVQRVGRFKPEDCSRSYLRWLILSPEYLRRLLNQQKGMDIPHLSKTEILEPLVPIPFGNEQEKIADRLSIFQQNIDLEKERRDKMIKHKSGLMHDLLTGRVPVNPDPAEETHV